jgi:hypothetical protein
MDARYSMLAKSWIIWPRWVDRKETFFIGDGKDLFPFNTGCCRIYKMIQNVIPAPFVIPASAGMTICEKGTVILMNIVCSVTVCRAGYK